MQHQTNIERSKRGLRLVMIIGLPLLILAVMLWGLQNVTPAHADPGMLYVDGDSGQDTEACGSSMMPCQTISYTLNSQANDGDFILVTAGTYTENLTISGISVTLRGGYTISDTLWLTDTGQTIVNGSDTGRVFFIHDSNSVLENITMMGGAADPSECWGDALWVTNADVTVRSSMIKDTNGGCNGIEVNQDFGPGNLTLESSTISNVKGNSAMHVWGEFASATVEATTFINNEGPTGGAINVDFNSTITISNSHFIQNIAHDLGGGIFIHDGASADIWDSQIISNTAQGAGGGGISVSHADLNVFNSQLMNNDAPNGQSGGIDVRTGSTVNVDDSTIVENTTQDHGGAATVDPGARLNLTNALITGNSTTSNNANVLAVNGTATIFNSTISDNNPQGAQGVIIWSGGNLTVTNSIFWNNALNIQNDSSCPSCVSVTYSNIQGGWTDPSNIDADPLFVGGGDYHLEMGSPSIDTGTDTGAPDHDLDQVPRPQDGNDDGTATTDMGAYEFYIYKTFLPLLLNNFGQ